MHLVVPRHAGVVARRAACFAPAPSVWAIEGTALVPAVAESVPVPLVVPPAPELAALLVDADLEVVVEDGMVRGEVLGLEVARIVHGTTTAGASIDAPVLEVGVGKADRELTGMLHEGMPLGAQLERVAAIVRAHRQAGAEPHPLNRLVPERWLRARLVADPGRIGLAELHSEQAAIARANLRERGVAMAVGARPSGEPVVVACSVGIDLTAVPAAADARLALAPEADLVLVVPERDAHPVTTALATRLARPAEVQAVPDDWREW